MRYRRCDRDGVYRWIDGRFEPLRNAEGTIIEWFGLSIDVDDEMRIQQSLRESQQSLQHFGRNVACTYLLRDSAGDAHLSQSESKRVSRDRA